MTIGFFSPLPLAMMIPFMATQSLAMGEAFGKSFQYGKRKISSMSNEEFNKYTITTMMAEQTADIRTLIPELTKQMQSSAQMQQQIFSEMIKLVPTFLNAITAALTGKSDNVLSSNLQSNISGTQDILNYLANLGNIPEAHADHDNEIQTFTQEDQDLQDAGKITDVPITLSSLTDQELKTAYQNKSAFSSQRQQLITLEYKKRFGNPKILAPPAPSIAKNKTQAIAFTEWQKILIGYQNAFLTIKKQWLETNNSYYKENAKAISRLIVKISQDYRNPNNAIRTAVIQLRREMNLWLL